MGTGRLDFLSATGFHLGRVGVSCRLADSDRPTRSSIHHRGADQQYSLRCGALLHTTLESVVVPARIPRRNGFQS